MPQGVSSNTHVAEERGQIVNDDTGMDEEDKSVPDLKSYLATSLRGVSADTLVF